MTIFNEKSVVGMIVLSFADGEYHAAAFDMHKKELVTEVSDSPVAAVGEVLMQILQAPKAKAKAKVKSKPKAKPKAKKV